MTPIEAVLFDLDDTLLGNNMDNFLEGYFSLLSEYVKDDIEPERFIPELIVGTQAMIGDTDSSRTNSDVFWAVFSERTGLDRRYFETKVSIFYEEYFGKLRSRTERRPAAKQIVKKCFERNLKVVVATNPLFPISAINQRLEWAGVPANSYNYSLITSYENMHASKPNPAYYEEILSVIDVEHRAALMVGDDWENDIVPAASLGLHTYWVVTDEKISSEKASLVDEYGSLEELLGMLSSDWPN